jgi:thiamine pyrophosphate-dependent acetolactate synthase large subunit-like protein
MPKIAEACGFKKVFPTTCDPAGLIDALNGSLESPLPAFIEARVSLSVQADLGRPKTAPGENKLSLMRFLHGRN